MRKGLLILSIGLFVFSTVAWADEEPRRRAPRTDRIRGSVPGEIKVLYAALTPLPLLEQRRALLEMSPAVKAQLWAYNLQLFAAAHRQMPEAQRDVLEDALVLLSTPGFFDPLEAGSEEYRMRQNALTLQKQALRAVFSDDALYPLFLRLGVEPPPAVTSLSLPAKPASGFYYCECMVTSGYAYECGSGVCQSDGIPMCTPWMGCGYWGLDGCDGMCR